MCPRLDYGDLESLDRRLQGADGELHRRPQLQTEEVNLFHYPRRSALTSSNIKSSSRDNDGVRDGVAIGSVDCVGRPLSEGGKERYDNCR